MEHLKKSENIYSKVKRRRYNFNPNHLVSFECSYNFLKILFRSKSKRYLININLIFEFVNTKNQNFVYSNLNKSLFFFILI